MKRNRFCTCDHTAKHHKRSGRCRGMCPCQAASIKARVKRLKVRA